MSRRPVSILAVVLLVFSLTLSLTTAAAAAERVTIRHMVWQFMFGEDIGFLQELAEEFTALHPDIAVELEIQRNIVDAAVVQTAGGIPPDALAVSSFDALPLYKQGVLYNLRDLLLNDPDYHEGTFLPGMLESYTLAGDPPAIYGVPYQVLAWTTTYNKDHFREAGVPFPQVGPDWNWESAREMGRRLTRFGPDGSTTRYGMMIDGSRRVDWAYWLPLTHQAGGGLFDRIIDPTTSNFNSEPVRTALEYLFSLYDAGIAPLWTREPNNVSVISGAVALQIHDIPTTVPNYRTAMGTAADIGHIRQPRGPVRDGWFADGQGFAIHAQSEKKDAAWTWLRFLTLRPESGEKLILDRARMSAQRGTIPFYLENADLFEVASVIDALGNPNNVPRPVLANSRFWSEVNRLNQRVVIQELGLAGALEEMDRLFKSMVAGQ